MRILLACVYLCLHFLCGKNFLCAYLTLFCCKVECKNLRYRHMNGKKYIKRCLKTQLVDFIFATLVCKTIIFLQRVKVMVESLTLCKRVALLFMFM